MAELTRQLEEQWSNLTKPAEAQFCQLTGMKWQAKTTKAKTALKHLLVKNGLKIDAFISLYIFISYYK